MSFNFKPFYLQTNAYFGVVTNNKACDESERKTYQESFKRALHHLSELGHHDFETIFNRLTRDTTDAGIEIGEGVFLPRFTFRHKENVQTLWEFLSE
jgi:hypothetical protein